MNNETTWKQIIIFIMILTLLIIFILVKTQSTRYEYETKVIELDNTNFGEDIWVTEYLCDDWVEVNNIQTSLFFDQHWFYASTWETRKNPIGKCMIIIKKLKI